MKKQLLACVLCLFVALQVNAQKPNNHTPSQIYEAVQKLNFLGSVLYVAAHPDDENTRLIAYMSNHEKARTGYLSLTRGDGGQNLIGPELRELLGVIRTQELLAARGIDGGEQLFTRANDFGFSKHPDETLEIWDKDQVLSDVVWAIRNFQPDVIINRFDHRTPGSTHGHHTSSAMLSMEAFDLANDKTKYPEQLKYTQTWQPKRIFFNTSWWFYGSEENFEKADKSKLLTFDIGVYYPLKGKSNNEIAALASSQHLCQGFGRLSQRGSQKEYIEFLKGEFPSDNKNLFSGIDTSWNRVKGGKAIGDILYKVEQNFNFTNPATHIPELLKAYQLVQKLENDHWKSVKSKELLSIIEACTGLYLEASASTPSASKESTVGVKIEALNRSDIPMVLKSMTLFNGNEVEKNIPLANNQSQEFNIDYHITSEDHYTSPYWLQEKGSLGMYKVDNQGLIGKPETPRAAKIRFDLEINNTPVSVIKDVVYRYSKPDKGELYKPFDIVPKVALHLNSKVYIFNSDAQKDITVTVKAGADAVEGYVSIQHPEGWQVYPEKQKLELVNKGDSKQFVFTVIPPKQQSEAYVTPIAVINGQTFSKSLVEIDYNHIPFQTVLMPSESKVVRLNIQKKGQNIGYIVGAGDSVPESLEQIGYNVVILDPETLSEATLHNLDAVVVGIRAYNVLENIANKQDLLFNFVKQGGNMVVQYNTSRGLQTQNLAPYNLELSRDRVTDEYAPVSFLNPDHELLNAPNKITEQDFSNWVQERGLYFPDKWDEHFTPLIALNDKNESPKTGSLLVTQYGKGYYIYTGLSFFRELPEGVPGAYRLFANMLSIGKQTIETHKTITD